MRGCYDVGVVCVGGRRAKGAAWRGSVGEGGDGLVVWWVRRVMCGEGVMGRRERVLVRDGMSVVAAWWCRWEGRTVWGGEAARPRGGVSAKRHEGRRRGERRRGDVCATPQPCAEVHAWRPRCVLASRLDE